MLTWIALRNVFTKWNCSVVKENMVHDYKLTKLINLKKEEQDGGCQILRSKRKDRDTAFQGWSISIM